MTSPRISVVMPVYNTRADYLKEAIDSILNQTFANFEFIIVDDGSTDKSVVETIKGYTDPRIKYFYKENDGGFIANTRNFGTVKAVGEFIAVMDSDDISYPDRFQKQVDYLDANPDIDLLGTLLETFPKKDPIRAHKESVRFFDILGDSWVMNQPTVMWRRAVFEKYNLVYDKKYKSEDYELWSQAVQHIKIANLPEVLLRYRRHENNFTHQKTAILESVDASQKKMLDFLTADKDLQNKVMELLKSELIKHDVEKITRIGLPLIKISKNKKRTKYYLFGFILIYRKRNK